MQIEIEMELVHAREFVRTAPTGHIDHNTAREILLRAAHSAEAAGNTDMIIDYRGVTSQITLGEITSLVYMMISHRDLFSRKLAIICAHDDHTGHLQFMEDFAVNRGLQVGAFADYEQAINWLMPSTPISVALEN